MSSRLEDQFGKLYLVALRELAVGEVSMLAPTDSRPHLTVRWYPQGVFDGCQVWQTQFSLAEFSRSWEQLEQTACLTFHGLKRRVAQGETPPEYPKARYEIADDIAIGVLVANSLALTQHLYGKVAPVVMVHAVNAPFLFADPRYSIQTRKFNHVPVIVSSDLDRGYSVGLRLTKD